MITFRPKNTPVIQDVPREPQYRSIDIHSYDVKSATLTQFASLYICHQQQNYDLGCL